MPSVTKPLTLKTFHVVIPGLRDPQALLDAFWRHFGEHQDRLERSTSKVVTAGEVRGSELHLAVEYTVRGGYPSDIRRWVGRILGADPYYGRDVQATLKETLYIDDEGRLRDKTGALVSRGVTSAAGRTQAPSR